MKFLILLIVSAFFACSCGKTNETNNGSSPAPQVQSEDRGKPKMNNEKPVQIISVKIKSTIQHDRTAFTQGLLFDSGILYESTGQNGASSLRKINPETGELIKKTGIPAIYFSEGIALLGNKLFMLTWMNGICFIYNKEDFRQIGSFNFEGEGWGLSTDGITLIMSDGSNILRYINPENFSIEKTVYVSDKGVPIGSLNELEFIDGNIWANIWNDDRIAVISPETGNVKAWIDLSPLREYIAGDNKVDVLNGIAYDQATKTIYLTGKYWPWIFEVEHINVD